MYEISIPLYINFTFDDEITLVNVSEKIREIGIEKIVLEEFVTKCGEIITTELCGEKYKHDKKNKRFNIAGTFDRKLITMLGEIDLKVDKIKDKLEGKIFRPLLDFLKVEPYKNYQDDISFTCTDIATKNSYRDTEYISEIFFKKTMSASTINKQVIEDGKEIKEFMETKNKKNTTETYDHLFADSTKSHTQEDIYKNDIQVVMTTNNEGEKVLLSCNVNKSWDEINTMIEELDVLCSDAVLISDAEPEIRNSLINGEMQYQLDVIHYIRDIGYYLWKDNKLDLDTRKDLLKKAAKIIYKLINQVNKYKNNKKVLKEKVNEAVDEFKEFSEYLYDLGCEITGKFVKKHSNHVVTFAILAFEDRNIPWNSNIIERLMGEIQKRCKHKWMRWTTQGQESILNLILTRFMNPEDYEEFKNQKLKSENLKNIQIKITT